MRSVALVLIIIGLSIPAAGQWEVVTQPRPGFEYSPSLHSTQGNIFVAYTGGVRPSIFRSSDLGITWHRADSTIPFVDYGTLTPQSFASIGNRVFVGTSDGVYRSTDLGATWTRGGTFAGYSEAYSLGTRDSTLFVGYYNVARSTNYGTSWTPASFGHPASITMAVVAAGNYVLSASNGVYRSTDGGVNFFSVNSRISSANTEDLVLSGTTLFAANSDSGVFRSTDYGTTWTLVNNGIVGFARHARRLLAGPGMVFVWTDSGMYATNNNGSNWVLAKEQELFTARMVIAGDFLFVKGGSAIQRHPLYDFFPAAKATNFVSGPGSYTFNPTGNITGVTLNLTSGPGGPVQVEVKRFAGAATAPSFSGTPPASTSDYRWVINGNPSGYPVTGEIRINLSAFGASVSDPTNIKIYRRSSSGIGSFIELPTMYVSATNEIVATITGFSEFIMGGPAGTLAVESGPGVPHRFTLEQNYPNPFNPFTTIRYEVPGRSIVSLTVANLLGQEIATLASGEVGAGSHEAVFDAKGLPSGVYFVRLSARGTELSGTESGFTAVRKMLLAK